MTVLSDEEKLQAQAHFSDYQAMMTRVNWFMSLQFMPLVPLVGFYSLIALASKNHYLDEVFITWGGAIMTQLAIIIYYFALHEVYNHVRYIETKLKPRVATILQLKSNEFWGWEGHLKLVGKAYDPRFGDLLPAAFSASAFIIAAFIAVTTRPASRWDCVGTVLSISMLLGAVLLAVRVVKVRKELEASA